MSRSDIFSLSFFSCARVESQPVPEHCRVPCVCIDYCVVFFSRLMNTVYFLIPGLRLPRKVCAEVIARTDFSQLLQSCEGAEEIMTQQLVHSPVWEGAAHQIWLWRVISKQNTDPEAAAFEWEADGGPSMGAQTWRLWSFHQCEDQTVKSPEPMLTQDERIELHDDLVRCVRRFGFELQQWEGRWYLTRKTDWAVTVKPWCAQKYYPVTEHSVSGEAREDFFALQQALKDFMAQSSVNEARRDAGMETVDGFWPDGGSRRHLLKASTLRAVMCNDSAVLGWAQNAGLLNFRTVPVSDDWPEAPEGDLLSVIDDLFESYRKADWQTWSEQLPEVARKLAVLSAAARKRRCARVVIVACGATDTHTISFEASGTAKGFLARFKKKKTLNLNDFLIERDY